MVSIGISDTTSADSPCHSEEMAHLSDLSILPINVAPMPLRSQLPSGLVQQTLRGIHMRSFLSSPLVVVGKGLKLTRNRSASHRLGSVEQSPCCLQIFLASL
jgi:hypothetical protein